MTEKDARALMVTAWAITPERCPKCRKAYTWAFIRRIVQGSSWGVLVSCDCAKTEIWGEQ